MQTDYHRSVNSNLLSADDLNEHHQQTFTLSIDLMLQALGARLRAKDMPELIQAFGWCSVVRDLQEDLDAGLINIPEDVFHKAMKEGADKSYNSLIQTCAVQIWMIEELKIAKERLDKTDDRLREFRNEKGLGVLQMFAGSIRKYLKKIYAIHPSLRILL